MAYNSTYSGSELEALLNKVDTIKHLVFNNVSASLFVSDTTYSDYHYKCEVACTGVLDTDIAEVAFGVTEAVSGNYAPVCLSGLNVVTIYSKVNTTIIIPTINIIRI